MEKERDLKRFAFKFECHIFQNPPNFNVDSFFWQNSFDLLFLLWFIKVGVAFRFFLNQLCPENSKTTVTVTREEFLNDI